MGEWTYPGVWASRGGYITKENDNPPLAITNYSQFFSENGVSYAPSGMLK